MLKNDLGDFVQRQKTHKAKKKARERWSSGRQRLMRLIITLHKIDPKGRLKTTLRSTAFLQKINSFIDKWSIA